VSLSRADEGQVAEHWRAFGERQSPLATSPRKAVTPAGAMLNYLYALVEFECRLALLAVGLDPGLGWAHRDAPYRDSAALGVLEALRPEVEAHLLQLLQSRTFPRREFAELPSGQVRLMPDLARTLASSLPIWEGAAATQAAWVARVLALSTGVGIRVSSAVTRGARGKGHGTMGRGSRKGSGRPRFPSSCRECGVALSSIDRQYCDECLPRFKDERTGRLVAAAREVLAEMRASSDDPARSPEAVAKRVATNAERRESALAWEGQNPGPHDPELFRREIAPSLQNLTLPQMMRATGLSSAYCWRIRRGDRVPHPMYWSALRSVDPEDGYLRG